ncbi:MAG: hypothetical protein IAA85_03600 [Firmicutes bacterium]|nr:hypothetical protein [Candidatus Alectryobacillus merdavium]
MAKRKYYSASEQLEAMTSQWADNKTIMIIGGVGLNKAVDIRKEIEQKIKEDGYNLPRNAIVPMKYVIDYFKIDINYLKKLASLERGN